MPLNECHFDGYFTEDPNLQRDKAGIPFIIFSLLIDENRGRPVVVDCEAWDTGAELISRRFRKGDLITVHCQVKPDEVEPDCNVFRVRRFEPPRSHRVDVSVS